MWYRYPLTTHVLVSGLAVAFVIVALAVSAGPSALVFLSVLVAGHLDWWGV